MFSKIRKIFAKIKQILCPYHEMSSLKCEQREISILIFQTLEKHNIENHQRQKQFVHKNKTVKFC